MNIKSKIDELKFIITRYDHYYDSVNNKGSLYLAINTFILGGVITGYFNLDNLLNSIKVLLVLFILTLVFNLISFIFTLIAIKPHLDKHYQNNNSVIYFNNVSNMSKKIYKSRWANINTKIYYRDLKKQVKALSCGLKNKFNHLSLATWFISLQIFCIVIFGLIILIK